MNKYLVIIPHFNKLLLLKECLYHLDNINDINFDVLIVDNGSSDGSSEYIYKLSKQNSKYKHILLNENMGFSFAVNKGLNYAIINNYEYSILLNNDAYVKEKFVSSLVNKISKSKKIFAVSSLMLSYHDKNIIDSFGDNYSIVGWQFQNKIGENFDTIEKDEECFSACAGASIYNNDVLKKIGLFDERFFAYLEDIDISFRAKLHGYKILTCKEAICYHLGSATSGSKYNEFKVRISARNSIYLIYKNMPTLQILLNIIPLSFGIIVKQIFFIMRGFGLDYFFGIVDGLRGIKKIRRVDFTKINILYFISIEIELIINLFKYVINFMKRHF